MAFVKFILITGAVSVLSSLSQQEIDEKPTLLLSQNPDHKVIYTGEQVTLTCKVQGSSSGWEYHWYKIPDETKVLNSDTSDSSFIISSAQLSDNGKYLCQVKRESVNFKSENHQLIIENPPQPKVVLHSGWKEVFPGEEVALKCEIPNKSLNWIYVWHINSEKILNKDGFTDNGSILLISSVTSSHGGKYTCTTEIKDRPKTRTISTEFVLATYEKPTLLLSQNPDHKVIYTGEQVTLTCKVQGSSSGWEYHWYKIPDETKVLNSDTSDSSFIISSAQLSNNGKYLCEVKRGSVNFKSENHQLIIENPPQAKVVLHSGWKEVFPGEEVALKCEIPNKSLNWIYVWHINSEKILNEDGFTDNGSILLISSVTSSHGGKYTCTTEIKDRPKTRAISTEFVLTTYEKPTLLLSQNPDHKVIYTGEQVTLTCKVQGSSSGWQYHWYKIPDETKVLNSDTSDSSFIISSAQLSNNGKYLCEVKRGSVNFKSENHQLIIENPPQAKVVLHSGWKEVFPGEEVALKCEIPNKSLNWIYVWHINSEKILNEDGFTDNGSILLISSVTSSHGGKYTCTTEIKDRPKTRAISTEFVLTTYEKLTLLLSQNPDHKVIYTGEQITLTCKVQGSSSGWEYHWYKIPDETKVLNSDTSDSSFIISSAQLSNNGKYLCEVKRGSVNFKSQNHQLIIENPPQPKVVLHSGWKEVFPGEEVALKCEIPNKSLNWIYVWHINSEKILNKDGFTDNGSILLISSVTSSHGGKYTCTTEIKDRPKTRAISTEFVLTTYETKPTLLLSQHPDYEVIYTEEQVTLTCEIQESSSGWEYHWYKKPDESTTLNSDTTKPNYTINYADSLNNGTYVCHVKRGGIILSSASHSLTIKTRSPTLLILETSWSDIMSVDSLTLKCEVSDALEWNYTWFKDSLFEITSTEQKYSVKATEDTFKSEYKCRGNRTNRPLYSSFSDGFKANNIVLKRKVLLAISGCVVCSIILLIIGCIALRLTRKPVKKETVKEDLFFSVTGSKTETTSPLEMYMMENKECSQTEALLNGTICTANFEDQIKADAPPSTENNISTFKSCDTTND